MLLKKLKWIKLVKLKTRTVPLRQHSELKSKLWNQGFMLLNKTMLTRMIKFIP